MSKSDITPTILEAPPKIEFEERGGQFVLALLLHRANLSAAVSARVRSDYDEVTLERAQRSEAVRNAVAAAASRAPQAQLDSRVRTAKLDRDILALSVRRAESARPVDAAALAKLREQLAEAEQVLAGAEAAAAANDGLRAEHAAVSATEAILSGRVAELRERLAAEEKRALADAIAATAGPWGKYLIAHQLRRVFAATNPDMHAARAVTHIAMEAVAGREGSATEAAPAA